MSDTHTDISAFLDQMGDIIRNVPRVTSHQAGGIVQRHASRMGHMIAPRKCSECGKVIETHNKSGLCREHYEKVAVGNLPERKTK